MSIFLGGTGSANELEDYEEGTWTVGFKFSNQDFNGSYGARTGLYTKIGRQVNVSFQLVIANKGSNNLRIKKENFILC